MTAKTPYDAEAREDLPYNSVSMRLAKARREAYLRARADMQPTLDALVAALRDCAAGLDEIAAYLRRTGDNPELALARANQARAALKLAGEPPNP